MRPLLLRRVQRPPDEEVLLRGLREEDAPMCRLQEHHLPLGDIFRKHEVSVGNDASSMASLEEPWKRSTYSGREQIREQARLSRSEHLYLAFIQ